MASDIVSTAVAAYQNGRLEDCVQLCTRGLRSVPTDDTLLLLLALAEQARGNLGEAATAFDQLTRLHPEVPEYWSNLGVMHRHMGRFADAEAHFERALSLAPKNPDVLVNYGLLLQDRGLIAEARHLYLDACEQPGHSAAARIFAALACIECGDTARAEAILPPRASWPHLDAAMRSDLTKALVHLGHAREAEAMLEAQAFHDSDPTAAVRLAALYERTNRVSESKALLDRVRNDLDPDTHVEVLLLDAALATRERRYSDATDAATRALTLPALPLQTQANAHFTLATAADKQGLIDNAMRHLGEAHALQFKLAQNMAPEIADSVEEPLRIASRWMSADEASFPVLANDPTTDESPVFIVGFPRSGTTMLEQMLDAHPDYVSMDERIFIQDCVSRMVSAGRDYPAQLGSLSDSDLVDLRKFYWSQADRVAPRTAGQILVDKNPLNMLRLPIIRRLFPNARIILALRHPCDVMLSCYMQNFRSPAFMVLCSTLERLAKSYRNAMQFWIHHQPLLEPAPLVLRYEETVHDFPAQVERIADFLGIRDRHHLAEFSKHAARKGYISTPSYSQVIEPVNTRAVSRWERYRSYFEPVFPILRPVADHWGYRLEPE